MALPAGLLLVLAALIRAPADANSESSTGVKFIVAFPENIAYYHPNAPDNKIQITALYDNTVVTVVHKFMTYPRVIHLRAGQTETLSVDARIELHKKQNSEKTLLISSTKTVTVRAISQKMTSAQAALVASVDNLGTEYKIPPVPRITGTTEPAEIISTEVTERSPFRLIVINSDQENTVTLEGADGENITLGPYKLAQVWVTEVEAVKAEKPVAVLFGHPCAVVVNCTCAMLFTPLSPAKDGTLKFFIPPIPGQDVESFLLLADKVATGPVPFSPDSPLMTTSGPAILYRPGLLLSLIPEEEFSSCYVINPIPDVKNFALLVVRKDQTEGVRLGGNPLPGPDWQQLKGTDYVSTVVDLEATDLHVLWHTSSKMAVYGMGERETVVFGNPAAGISKHPDFRGCAVSTEVIEIGDMAHGWPESVKYCREKDLELLSLDSAAFQKQILWKLSQAKADKLKRAWIGLRRSSLTGQWYWVSKIPVNYTNWDRGEPGGAHEGQCAMMTLDAKKNFGWRDEDCCEAAFPVCYSKSALLPV